MMKNNQMFQRLGLSTLASMINNTSSKSKDDVSQESGSLYDLRIVRALNKRRLARYTFFSALQCLSYDYYLYICSYTNFCFLSCAIFPI